MVTAEALRDLAASYKVTRKKTKLDDLKRLANDYVVARGVSILDAAAIGLAFDAVFSEDTVDITKITPEMATAWNLAYPNVPIESLAGRSPESLAGAISGWKGKLFEVEVEQRLNNGEWVGDLHLDAGQHAELAASATQPGWDIQIFDDDGSVASAIQLKATESVSYIHHALERYPDTPILATHEVAMKMVHDGVIDSGIDVDTLTDSIHDHVADATTDTLSDGVMGAMPVSVILATEAYKVLRGGKSVDQAITSGGDRLAKGAVSAAVAGAVSVVATPFVGAIAGFLTRIALGGEEAQTQHPEFIPPSMPRMRAAVGSASKETRELVRYYPHDDTLTTLGEASSTLTDDQELLRLVDNETRLEIESNSMPLSSWLEKMISANMHAMSEDALSQHLRDLQWIRREGLVDRAFPAPTFLGKLSRLIDGDHRTTERGLETAIQIGGLLQKKFNGTFTDADAEAILLAGMTPFERGKYEGKKSSNARRKAMIKDALTTLSTEQVREIFPDAFNPDGTLKE